MPASSTSQPPYKMVTIIFYQTENLPPITFDIPLSNSWLAFGYNTMFRNRTRYPDVKLEIFDPETRTFVPLFTSGGILVDSMLHPWVIFRDCDLVDSQCRNLDICIWELMETRKAGRRLFEGFANAHAGFGGAQSTPGLGHADAVGGSANAGGSAHVGGTAAGDASAAIQNGAGYGVIVIDDNSDDSDYSYESPSNDSEGGSDMDDDGTELEEEGMETDEEERAVIDLTYSSDLEL